MYEGYQTLTVSREDGIVTVKFNRPEVLNATNPLMHQELMRVFPEIGRDPQANVVVLTGEGSAFSAGGDFDALEKSLDDQERWIESMNEARSILYGVVDLDRPVIAKINGPAIGLGATLALFCDIVVAAEDAKIADPHVLAGLVAGDGGSVIWPALVGFAKAKYYLLTGRALSGLEAERIGLISEAVPADQLDGRVDKIAIELANGARNAVRMTKRAVNMALRQQLDTMIEAHLGLETMSHLNEDHREAVSAFKEKRRPSFSSR